MTVEGCPSLDRNWACKHLTTLAKSRSVLLQTSEVPQLCSMSKFESQGHLQVKNTRTCEMVVGGDPSHALPDLQTQGMPKKSCERENEMSGALPTTEKEEAVTVDTDSSESELSMSSENEDDDESIYKLPYQAHRLSHMLAKVIDGKPQASGLAALQNDYELKTLPQELQKDKEAQSLANAMQGCLIRRCLFRDGKGGIFVCSQGQARVEGSIFRYLTYAMRCAENSKVL